MMQMMMVGMIGSNPSFNSRYMQQNVSQSMPMVPPFISVSTLSPPDIEQVIPILSNNATNNDEEDDNEVTQCEN